MRSGSQLTARRKRETHETRGLARREQDGAAPMLRARIQEEKTLDWLIDNASIKTVEPAAAPDSADGAPAASGAAAGADWNKSMKKAELLEVAKGKGLSVTTKMTKAQIIEVLEGA